MRFYKVLLTLALPGVGSLPLTENDTASVSINESRPDTLFDQEEIQKCSEGIDALSLHTAESNQQCLDDYFKKTYKDEAIPKDLIVEIQKGESIIPGGVLYRQHDIKFFGRVGELLNNIKVGITKELGFNNAKFEVHGFVSTANEFLNSTIQWLDNRDNKIKANTADSNITVDAQNLVIILRETVMTTRRRYLITVKHEHGMMFNLDNFYDSPTVSDLITTFDNETHRHFLQDYNSDKTSRKAAFYNQYKLGWPLVPITDSRYKVLNAWVPGLGYTFEINHNVKYLRTLAYNIKMTYIPTGYGEGVIYTRVDFYHDGMFPCLFECKPVTPKPYPGRRFDPVRKLFGQNPDEF
ncbi:hypothetical protein WICPIJ_000499 [Wickerhamomyces pijperi]|uniref:Uncharacterized protein n=1 Tax=Wickerhamomyces pijperi TaxID=599730 RepID=A0A9P8QGT9_WICPI|nr:hypothetical protein WICPIJ_000499 [Wickerhamomyces pijperi]